MIQECVGKYHADDEYQLGMGKIYKNVLLFSICLFLHSSMKKPPTTFCLPFLLHLFPLYIYQQIYLFVAHMKTFMNFNQSLWFLYVINYHDYLNFPKIRMSLIIKIAFVIVKYMDSFHSYFVRLFYPY